MVAGLQYPVDRIRAAVLIRGSLLDSVRLLLDDTAPTTLALAADDAVIGRGEVYVAVDELASIAEQPAGALDRLIDATRTLGDRLAAPQTPRYREALFDAAAPPALQRLLMQALAKLQASEHDAAATLARAAGELPQAEAVRAAQLFSAPSLAPLVNAVARSASQHVRATVLFRVAESKPLDDGAAELAAASWTGGNALARAGALFVAGAHELPQFDAWLREGADYATKAASGSVADESAPDDDAPRDPIPWALLFPHGQDTAALASDVVGRAVGHALRTWGGEAHESLAADLLRHRAAEIREAACRLLHRHGSVSSVPVLLAAAETSRDAAERDALRDAITAIQSRVAGALAGSVAVVDGALPGAVAVADGPDRTGAQ